MSNRGRGKRATVAVEGNSMEPTYSEGDWLMAKWARFTFREKGFSLSNFLHATVQVGDVVVLERPEYPGIYYIKRITEIRRETFQIFVSSDNPEGNDSRQWGLLPLSSVQAKVTSRIRKAKKK